MPSKGIDVFAYNSSNRFQVRVECRGYDNVCFPFMNSIQQRHFEMDTNNIHWYEATGAFRMYAMVDGKDVLERGAEINPNTGGLAANNVISWVDNQRSQIGADYAVSWGFTDVATMAGLSHQAYVFVTGNQSDWMKRMNAPAETTLNEFVLPGSHDSGMYVKLTGPLGVNAFYNTQKDDVSTQLQLGARYFDFRPGHMWNLTAQNVLVREERLCHLHSNNGIIAETQAGEGFENFLQAIVTFLTQHSGEIVVVKYTNDGFGNNTGLMPDAGEVEKQIRTVMAKSKLVRGTVSDLASNYAYLVSTGKRLIIYDGDDSSIKERGSYWKGNYATENPNEIIAALDKTLNTQIGTDKYAATILQVAGSFQGTLLGIKMALSCGTHDGGPLLYTKARFDNAVQGWLRSMNNSLRFDTPLVVLLDDYVDNALTELCIHLMQERMTQTKTYSIGDTGPAGGIIVYAAPGGIPDSSGVRYLEAAPLDQSAGVHWLSTNKPIIPEIQGLEPEGIGKGKINTAHLLRTHSSDAFAAKLCHDLVINGYDDWYLPSKEELNLIYLHAKQTGKSTFAHNKYWASSINPGGPWADQQDFDSGAISCTKKTAIYEFAVRGIRSF